MTLKEMYDALHDDYEGVVERLGSEETVHSIALKFPRDPNYALLTESLAEGNIETAFRAVHTIKGICLNLGFNRLYRAAYELTEKLRRRNLDGTTELFLNVKTEYVTLISLIEQVE